MSGAGAPPPVPRWIRWALHRFLDERETRTVLDELAELHAAVAARHGVREADRRYRRQLRQYPLRLLAGRIHASLSSTTPGSGELGRAARSLLRSPGLTATIVLTVGLGIGGCATIFSMVDALYLQPLPYADADRLVWIYTDAPPNLFPFSVVDFEALRDGQTAFDHVAAVRSAGRALKTDDGVQPVQVMEATPGLLETWGLQVVRGRTPTREEGLPGASGTAMVTVGFAERVLGATDPEAALGRTVTLDDRAYEIIGILPPSLGPVERPVQIVPTLRLDPPTRKGPFFLRVYGHLAPGVEPQVAAQELRTLSERLFPLWADSYQDRSASWGLMPAEVRARGGAGPLLGVLMAAVGMVLLIALTNAANLLLARVNARGRELAVRSALGATRGRIWSHLLVESGLLAAGGAALGLGLARLGVAALPLVAHDWLPRTDEAGVNGHAVLFALALAVGSALLFVAVPAVHRRHDRDLAEALHSGGRTSTTGGRRHRSQRLLVAGQLAVVVPLLSGATLLVGSFARLRRVDPGFDADHTLTMSVMLSPVAYPDGPSRERFWRSALERIEAIPGVRAAALSSERPPDNVNDVNNFDLEDRPTTPGDPIRLAAWIVVGPSYFDALDVPLVEGRGFEAFDLEEDAPPVVLVDEAWVRRNYPDGSPVGRRLYSGGQTSGPRTTVVGVVGTVPYMGLGASDLGAMYEPSPDRFRQAWLSVRTSGDPKAVAETARGELRRLDPGVPVTNPATGRELLRDSLTRPRDLSLLLAVFSAVALALAVVGVYGVTSFSVQQGRGSIAVRLALGGAPGSVLRRTIWAGMRIALLGLAIGLAGSLALTGTLSGLLYGVAPRDPLSLAAAALVMLAVSALACVIPAVRAVRVDPASTLRLE